MEFGCLRRGKYCQPMAKQLSYGGEGVQGTCGPQNTSDSVGIYTGAYGDQSNKPCVPKTILPHQSWHHNAWRVGQHSSFSWGSLQVDRDSWLPSHHNTLILLLTVVTCMCQDSLEMVNYVRGERELEIAFKVAGLILTS